MAFTPVVVASDLPAGELGEARPLVWDEKGRLMTHAPSTYKIPACSDRPMDLRIALWSKGRNVEDTITARPEINCMVGFYSYNTPRIYEALKEAGKIGKVTIIGFDEDAITLGGVKEGTIVGTVVQQPYEWGYQGMKDMAKYLEGDKSFIPANHLIIVPTKIIDKSNVDAFWTELKARQGKK